MIYILKIRNTGRLEDKLPDVFCPEFFFHVSQGFERRPFTKLLQHFQNCVYSLCLSRDHFRQVADKKFMIKYFDVFLIFFVNFFCRNQNIGTSLDLGHFHYCLDYFAVYSCRSSSPRTPNFLCFVRYLFMIASSDKSERPRKTSKCMDPLTPLTLLPIMCKCMYRKSSRNIAHATRL